MAQNKEQLNKLLLFIKRLVEEPGNEDFANDLRKLLNIPNQSFTNSSQLSDIEKYLGLDYKLDKATPNIDYTFVKEPFVRDQLTSDYREMLRYRYGVRSHKIDFSEFCRYAMLQVEQLINYYYQNGFESEEEVVSYINENSFITIEKIDSIKSLSLAVKLSAFSKNLERKQSECLDFAREVRNEQSHRSAKEELDKVKAFRERLINMGLPLTKEGEVYKKGINNDSTLKTRFNSIEKSAYWKYRYQLWRFREPFDNLTEAIKILAQQIESQLKQKKL